MIWRCILLSYQPALQFWGIEGEDEPIIQVSFASEPGSLKPIMLNDQHGLKTATVVFWPEQSLSYRDEILFSWENLPCSTITIWDVSRGKENACHPVAGDKRRAKLVSNEYKAKLTVQRDTPSLFHTQKDFPVIQPAVVIRVSENLAEQWNTVIKINTPPVNPPVITF